jgi:hypothetical protein
VPRLALGAAGIVALIAVVYVQVRTFGFLSLDDDLYVSRNPRVLAGMSWDGVAWAFTTFHAGNWHPLTWLSLMLDVQVLGRNPGPLHLVNVVSTLAWIA